MNNKIKLAALKSKFDALATQLGFIQVPPAALLSEDETLLFANSTITGYKQPLLTGNLPFPGVSIAQACIRNQNLKSIRNWKQEIEYMSCFTQLGLLGGPQSLSTILRFVFNFLETVVGQRGLLCRTSSGITLNDWVRRTWDERQIETDARPISYYRWQYGIKGVSGEGMTFAVHDNRSGLYRDIGNLIEISDSNGVLGYEFGFGLETLDSRLRDFSSPFKSSLMHDYLDLPAAPTLKKKLMDSLMLCAMLCSIGVDEAMAKRGSILRHAMNDLFYLTQLCKLKTSVALAAGRNYLAAQGLADNAFASIFATFEQRIGAKQELAQQYIEYAKRHAKPWDQVRDYCIARLGMPAEYFELLYQDVRLQRPLLESPEPLHKP